jgi:hypothetical protein
MNILTSTNGQYNEENRRKAQELSAGQGFMGFFGEACRAMPYVLEGDGAGRYILLDGVPDDLAKWIETGETEKSTFRAMPESREKELKSKCRKLGLSVTQGWQTMEYMGHVAEIGFLRVTCPSAKTSVALIPWFMMPRKRYPAFVYIHACWLRQNCGKSVRESARAASELFGVDMHYSTVSRNAKIARALVGIGGPVPAEAPPATPFSDILDALPGILSAAAGTARPSPSGAGPAEALANIPLRFAGGAKAGALAAPQPRCLAPPAARGRRGPAKPKGGQGRKPSKPRPAPPLSEKERGGLRRGFIALCRCLILNAAGQHHTFFL